MKKILITGANSYIGTNLTKWLKEYSDKYSVDTISLRDSSWKEKDFYLYDVVIHVAGIAHIKETKENANNYYRVNRDLAYETAIKAKNDGVRQFIFLSSMSVYGIESGVINSNTPPNPKSNYGKSKLEAEKSIKPLGDEHFKIAILRPPMVYGKGCRGNYSRLANIALTSPLFPNIENKRSMIFIDNLCKLFKLIIDDCSDGYFFPQNAEYVCSSEMVKYIAKAHGKRIYMTKIFNPFLKFINNSTVNKVFGDLVYERKMSEYKEPYYLYDFEESIYKTEV